MISTALNIATSSAAGIGCAWLTAKAIVYSINLYNQSHTPPSPRTPEPSPLPITPPPPHILIQGLNNNTTLNGNCVELLGFNHKKQKCIVSTNFNKQDNTFLLTLKI